MNDPNLRAKAEAAREARERVVRWSSGDAEAYQQAVQEWAEATRAYGAAIQPETIKALLDERDRLRVNVRELTETLNGVCAERDDYEKALQKIEALLPDVTHYWAESVRKIARQALND